MSEQQNESLQNGEVQEVPVAPVSSVSEGAGPAVSAPSQDRRSRRNERSAESSDGLREEIIHINRVAKVVKGGRTFSFSAMVVVGDENGTVGLGMGKAGEVPDAIRKGMEQARRNLQKIPLKGGTIPHRVLGRFGASRVMLRPASKGTGVIAGGAVRAVVQAAGVRDILTKNIQGGSAVNAAKAAMQGLLSLKQAADLAESRGKTVPELWTARVHGGQE